MLTLYKINKFIFRYLIPPAWRYAIVRVLARVIIFFNRPRRTVIVRNLTPLIGARLARQKAPELLGHFLMTAVDFFCPHPDLLKRLQIENSGLLDRMYRRHKKVILLTAHLGTWELGMSWLVEQGFQVSGVYAPYRSDEIVRWILAHRNPEVEWIPATRGAAEACLSALERGRVLGMVADIPFGEKGSRVTIAGATTHLPLGPWSIAARSQAVVIPAFIWRDKPGVYRGCFHDPILPGEGTLRRRITQMQERYRSHLEHYLLAYPTQWGVLQPYWNRPARA